MSERLTSVVVAVGLAIFSGGCTSCTAPPSSMTAATPVVSSLLVKGTAPTIGTMVQFSAIAVLSNGTTQTVTSQATWQSSLPTVATVADTGIVTGVSVGSTDITATYRNLSGVIHIAVAALTPLPAPTPAPVPVSSQSIALIGSRRFRTDSA